MVASLEKQARHIELTGKPEPYARSASRAAKGLISPGEYRSAMRIHDRANLAKHSWADELSDALPEESGGPSQPVSCKEQLSSCDSARAYDSCTPPLSGVRIGDTEEHWVRRFDVEMRELRSQTFWLTQQVRVLCR